MNNSETRRAFMPTLKEGDTLHDFAVAHEKDQEDGGNRVEEMYPQWQAQADHAQRYQDDLTHAKTPEDLEKLKKAMQPVETTDDNPKGESEFDAYTGKDENTRKSIEKRIPKKEEEFARQEKTSVVYIQRVTEARTRFDIMSPRDGWLHFAEGERDNGAISPEQFARIKEAADAKLAEISEEQTEIYIQRVTEARTRFDIMSPRDGWLHFAEGERDNGAISPEQFARIKEAADAKLAEISEEQTEIYIQRVTEARTRFDIMSPRDGWLHFAEGERDNGAISPEQFARIKEAADAKLAEISEEQTEIYIQRVTEARTRFDIMSPRDGWLHFAEGERDNGAISPEQFAKIKQAANNRILELNDGV